MGFDDLEEAEEENNHQQSTTTESSEPPSQESSAESAETTDETSTDTAQTETNAVADEQAFPFSATEQDALYARPDAWEQFEDLLDLELEMELRERGVRDVSKSEKYDAVLRVIADYPEEIADQIEQARREP